jgi:hypothetical protein
MWGLKVTYSKWTIKPYDKEEKVALSKYILQEISNPFYRKGIDLFESFVKSERESNIAVEQQGKNKNQ